MLSPKSTATLPPPSTAALLLFLTLALTLTLLAHTIHAATPWPHHQTQTHNNKPTTDLEFGSSKKFEGSSEFVHLNFLSSISAPGPGPTPPTTTTTTTTHRQSTVSAWWRTVRLYTDQTNQNISETLILGQEKNDRFYSHGKSLTRLSIQDVIKSAVTSRTKPLPINPKSGLYLLLTSADVAVQDFCGQVCGFHYFTFPSIVGYTLPYAWVGNSATQCPGSCAYPFAVPTYIPGLKPKRAPNGDIGVDGMVSVIGHEIAELATNPLVNAWYAGQDPSFPTEIADLCEGIYGTGGGGSYMGQLMEDGRDGATYNVVGNGGRRFLVQWLWNPVLSYCFGPNALDQ
ncbi:hypothetical protein Syun_012746 [Stephania yunnanensis]|uniref:Phosphate-induced protein 1 n=1 Tax=Stephania yunnanensis TaxID=152371 RepID=A0AAP0K024_9MAGN